MLMIKFNALFFEYNIYIVVGFVLFRVEDHQRHPYFITNYSKHLLELSPILSRRFRSKGTHFITYFDPFATFPKCLIYFSLIDISLVFNCYLFLLISNRTIYVLPIGSTLKEGVFWNFVSFVNYHLRVLPRSGIP